MPGEASTQTRWTEAEKLKVMFSIIDNATKIEWASVYVPEGRTIKAVKCMIDTERKRSKDAANSGEGAGSNANANANGDEDAEKPKRKRATPHKNKTDDGEASGEPSSPAPKKRRTPKKTTKSEAAVKKEDEDDDVVAKTEPVEEGTSMLTNAGTDDGDLA